MRMPVYCFNFQSFFFASFVAKLFRKIACASSFRYARKVAEIDGGSYAFSYSALTDVSFRSLAELKVIKTRCQNALAEQNL